jgi:hypothetical protein
MRFSPFVAAAVFVLLSLAGPSFARTFGDTNANIAVPSPAVWYIGKFCFNPTTQGQLSIAVAGGPTTTLVLMDDQPDSWPAASGPTGFARAGTVVTTDAQACNGFLTAGNTYNEFNSSLPIPLALLSIKESYRRNWHLAFVNCAQSDNLLVSSYNIVFTQGDGSPLSCEKFGKYELFASYFSFSFVALVALIAFAKKIGIAVFELSAPHALMFYAFIVFTLGLTFVLADADSQRGSGNLVPQGRQSFGMFLLQVADWMMLAHAFTLCSGFASFAHLKDESSLVKAVLAAFCLTYLILSIVSVAVDGGMYNQSDYTDAQPVNAPGLGISILRFLLFLYLGYTASKSYQAQTALETKSFLRIFYLSTLTWQLIVCICVMATYNSNPFSQMISVWASTLTFNFLYLSCICFLLMSRWTDVPAKTKGVGNRQPFIDDDVAPGAGNAAANEKRTNEHL